MFNRVRNGRVLFPGDGKNRFAHLHVEDAARILIAVVEKGWTGISPVGGDLLVDWVEFFAEYKLSCQVALTGIPFISLLPAKLVWGIKPVIR